MTHILGGNTQMAILRSMDGKTQLRFWAERGLIRVEDSRDNSFETLSVKEVLIRMAGLSDMLGNKTTSDESIIDNAYRTMIQKYLEDMIDIVRQAQEQGQPTDESAIRDLNRRRAKTFTLPNGAKVQRNIARADENRTRKKVKVQPNVIDTSAFD